MAAYSLDSSRDAVRQVALDLIAADSRHLSRRILDALEHAKGDLRYLINLHTLSDVAEAPAYDGIGPVSGCDVVACTEAVAEHFANFTREHPEYVRLSFLDRAGRDLLMHDSEPAKIADSPFFRAIGLPPDSVYVAPLGLGQPGRAAVLRFAATVHGYGGRPVGVLVADLSAAEIIDRVADRSSGTVAPYLVDEGGRFIYHPDPAKVWGAGGATIAAENPELAGRLGSTGSGITNDGTIFVTAAIVPVPQEPSNTWTLLLTASPQGLFAGLRLFERNLVLAAIAIGLLAIATGLAVADGMVLLPLRRLMGFAERLGRGELGARAPAPRGDEFGQLAYRLDEMSQRIASAHRNLESQVRERTAQLHEREALLARIFEVANVGLALVDGEGHLLRLNEAFAALAGEPPHVLVGRRIQDVLPLPADPGPVPQEVESRRGDGRPLWSWISVGTIERDGAAPLQIVSAVDIGALKDAEAALDHYARELERSNADLENFAYVASHDLQEPLRKIQTFASFLREEYAGRLDEDGRHYIERLADAATRMRSLIQDLLAYSRLLNRPVEPVRVSLDKVAADVLNDVEDAVAQSGGRVDVGPLGVVLADETQMHQLLQNLVSNAVKYRRPGHPPTVTVASRVVDSPVIDPAVTPISALPDPVGLCLQLAVTDDGIGIDEKYLAQIFKFFARLHNRDEYGGTGIGLALCRRIVETHHGAVSVYSKPGEGSRFVVTLPLPADWQGATLEQVDER